MKKFIALILITIILLAPIFSFTYYEEDIGLVIKNQSLVKTFIDTIKNGTY
jgi:hypothetical protein